jgi:photosystem II stability/assembly factor-like uncharacterized protein
VPTPRRSAYFEASLVGASDGTLGDDAGRFYTTRNGGRTWKLVNRGGRDLRTFFMLTRSHGSALDADFALHETVDAGRTWHSSPAPVRRAIGLGVLGPRHIWVADAPASILRSSDGGRAWQRIELHLMPADGSFDFVTPLVGYVGVWVTTDGGRDWKLVG